MLLIDRCIQKSRLHLRYGVQESLFVAHLHREQPDKHSPQVTRSALSGDGEAGNEVHCILN